MEFSEYPLLNTPHLALIIMKASATASATLDDAVAFLRSALQMAREDPPFDDTALRSHLEEVAAHLSQRGLLGSIVDGRLRITRRGREVVARYPKGFDFADLADRLEVRRRTRRQRSATTDPRGREFDEGYDAHRRGESLSDNPYMQDSINHLAWEDGWCEARDDAARAYAA